MNRVPVLAAVAVLLAAYPALSLAAAQPPAPSKKPAWTYPRAVNCYLAIRWSSENAAALLRPGELEIARTTVQADTGEGRTPAIIGQYLTDAWGQLQNGYAAGHISADALRGLTEGCVSALR